MKSLCVFCGSRAGGHPEYVELARACGTMLAERGIALVYGGGRVGLMGAIADAALAAGGTVIGVIPQMLLDREVGHPGLSQLHVVKSLAERKLRMAELSDAFVALPGGLGTLDELSEVWTWTQLNLHRKPCALLNAGGYFDALIDFLHHATDEGFVSQRDLEQLQVHEEFGALLDALGMHPPET
ncbi:MAG TPA: TIGR00730 family Rossman fold protein [Steroidobacteraceae bacterium]|nr:TIGR00730 family Rossman fold protein [Steroidobacteraceae bacterium]